MHTLSRPENRGSASDRTLHLQAGKLNETSTRHYTSSTCIYSARGKKGGKKRGGVGWGGVAGEEAKGRDLDIYSCTLHAQRQVVSRPGLAICVCCCVDGRGNL
jgi:hypothetical protein